MIAVTLGSLGVAELVVIGGLAALLTERVLDATGLSRSSKTLRRENEDLVRRNQELDSNVARLSAEVQRLKSEIEVLMPQVAELQKRDQSAVLTALADHERNAGTRHERMVSVLTEIRDAVKAA